MHALHMPSMCTCTCTRTERTFCEIVLSQLCASKWPHQNACSSYISLKFLAFFLNHSTSSTSYFSCHLLFSYHSASLLSAQTAGTAVPSMFPTDVCAFHIPSTRPLFFFPNQLPMTATVPGHPVDCSDRKSKQEDGNAFLNIGYGYLRDTNENLYDDEVINECMSPK